MIRGNRICELFCVVLLAGLSLISGSGHAQDTRRCQIKGKTVITNMTCEQLANEAGISPPEPISASRAESLDKPAANAHSAPVPIQPNRPAVNSTSTISPAKIILGSLIPVILTFGFIALLVAWLKIRAKRALYDHLGSLVPIAREALEPVSTKAPSPEETLPYRQSPVMTRSELELFDRLKSALPECEIFPQVPLASFIRIDKQRAGRRYSSNSYRWQNRISQQRVDFLACFREDMSILSAIELDDPSHNAEEAMQRDEKKNKSLRDADISLIRWRVEAMPDQQEIRREFARRGLLS